MKQAPWILVGTKTELFELRGGARRSLLNGAVTCVTPGNDGGWWAVVDRSRVLRSAAEAS